MCKQDEAARGGRRKEGGGRGEGGSEDVSIGMSHLVLPSLQEG